jgi:hypothetical protein
LFGLSKTKKSTSPAGYGKEGILRSLTSEALVFGENSVGWRRVLLFGA